MQGQVTVTGENEFEIESKIEVLEKIGKILNVEEIQRLGKIAQSENARPYLNEDFTKLKYLLQIK